MSSGRGAGLQKKQYRRQCFYGLSPSTATMPASISCLQNSIGLPMNPCHLPRQLGPRYHVSATCRESTNFSAIRLRPRNFSYGNVAPSRPFGPLVVWNAQWLMTESP